MAKAFDQYDQDELRELMIAQVAADRAKLIERGYFIMPWENAEYDLRRDHAQLMTFIADNAGVDYDIELVRKGIGFRSIGNTKTTVKSCIKAGLIEERNGRLNLTFLGRELLEDHEDSSGLLSAA